MKRILLASASIVAFAGAAAAEVTFNGEATLGYNNTEALEENDAGGFENIDDDTGFYWSGELGITFTQELDNGLTAAATVTSDVVDNQLEGNIFAEGYVFSLTSDTGSLFFGDTDQAANLRWNGVSEMAQDGFSETDGDTVLRGDFMAYGLDVSLSGLVDDTTDSNLEGAGDTIDQLSVGVAGTFGAFEMTAAYQPEEDDYQFAVDNPDDAEDFNPDEIFGISVGTAFAGADVDVAYARNMTEEESSTGIEAAYPIGPVTLGAFYVVESDDEGDSFGVAADYVSGPITVTAAYEEVREGEEDWAIDAGYDMGMGLGLFAGVADAGDDAYAAVTYDLAEGSQLLVSYGHDDDRDSEDEIGDLEVQEGTTVEVNFIF